MNDAFILSTLLPLMSLFPKLVDRDLNTTLGLCPLLNGKRSEHFSYDDMGNDEFHYDFL